MATLGEPGESELRGSGPGTKGPPSMLIFSRLKVSICIGVWCHVSGDSMSCANPGA